MSDCKHERLKDYTRPYRHYLAYCEECDKDFDKDDLDILNRAEQAEAERDTLKAHIDKLLRFINGVGMADQYKAFCVKESKR